MGSVVTGMDKALASMNIEQISKVMDKFEQQFEELGLTRTLTLGCSYP